VLRPVLKDRAGREYCSLEVTDGHVAVARLLLVTSVLQVAHGTSWAPGWLQSAC
jgi:hypothetical protein